MSIYDKASLVLIPSGTKTSKVYSQKPVNGDGDFTFTRSTAATRVNADGNIEKETQNLFSGSNDLDNTSYWIHTNLTSVTGGQAGYDGSSNAWLINKTGSSGRVYQSITSSGVQTISIYAKAGSVDWCLLQSIGGSNPYAYFDLGNGVVGSIGGGTIDSSIESIGNGWYRCQQTFNASITEVRFSPSDANSASGTSGNAYFQDAQIEQGLVARDYIETTTAAVEGGITDNVPRLDYTDSSCPALLLEPQRTNKFTQSEHFDGNAWTSYGGVVLTSNNAVSPEGVQNATKMIDAGGVFDQIPYTQNTDYTYSVFAKTDTATSITIGFVDQAAGYLGGKIRYTFATNVASVLTQSANGSVTAHREDYGNGWFRVIIRFKTNVAQNYNYQFIEFDGGDGWIYGAQLEAASYATSYIPTYGTSVTRNADAASKTGISSLIGQTEGTIYWEGKVDGLNSANAAAPISLFATGANTNGAQAYIDFLPNQQIRFVVYDGAVVQCLIATSTAFYTFGTTYKIAAVYKANDFALYINGVQIGTDTSGSVVALDEVYFDYQNNVGKYSTNQSLLFPTRLTNAELAALTTI